MKFPRLAAALAALALWTAPASAATVLAYNSFNDKTLAPAFLADDMKASDIHRGHGLDANDGRTFNSRNWTVGGSYDEAIKGGDYLIWKFASAMPLDLLSIDFGFRRSMQGPQSLALDITVNGSDWNTIYKLSGADFPALKVIDAAISLTSFTGVTYAAFRLTGWDARLTTGTFNFADSKALDGYAVRLSAAAPMAAIPLPPALPLLGAGVLMLVLLRRRRPSTA